MRSSLLIRLCMSLSVSALAVHQLATSCSAQCSGCPSNQPAASVTANLGDSAPVVNAGQSVVTGYDTGSEGGCCDCGCEEYGVLRGRLRSNLMGRLRGTGRGANDCCESDACGCGEVGGPSLRSRLFLENPIPPGPATGIRMYSRGIYCDDDCSGCEGCQGGLFSNIGTGRIASGLADRASNFGGRLRSVGTGGLAGSSGFGDFGACQTCGMGMGIGDGSLASRLQGGGMLGGGLAGSGILNRGLTAAKGIVGPGRGDIPHTSQPPYGEGMGQQAPTYAYPYYTARAPRDFLMDNPPSIGW